MKSSPRSTVSAIGKINLLPVKNKTFKTVNTLNFLKAHFRVVKENSISNKSEYGANQLYFNLFLALWTLLNLTNAFLTDLANDEAYYWIYSRNLDWGYFDHPPAIAAMIKAGYALFPNELGVRLFSVLSNSLSLILLWKLCGRYGKDLKLFIFLISGIVTFHVYGFIIVPDAPLLVATVLYFYALNIYFKKENLFSVFLLSILIAFLLYSKYHGLLILFFSILAYPKLVLKKSFWIITLFSLLLFLPHIWWQFQNDFLTLKFHLFDRGDKAYKLSHTINYLLGVLLITGPILGLVLCYALLKAKPESKWERVLHFNIIGFVSFFFLVSFSHKIEPNWVSPIVIPLVIVSYKYIKDRSGLRKWAIWIGGISLGLILLFRFYTIYEPIHHTLAANFEVRNEFHNHQKWAGQIEEKSNGRPVVFLNSYQETSKYIFYTNKPAHSYNTPGRRSNHFDLIETEADIQGADVLVVSRYFEHPEMSPFETISGTYYTALIENYRSYSKVEMNLLEENLILEAGKVYPFKVRLKNNFNFPVTFSENIKYPAQIVISVFGEHGLKDQQFFTVELGEENLKPGDTISKTLLFRVPEDTGKYQLSISFKSNWLDPDIGISGKKILVEE